jgi:hypothetical protein
LEAASAFGRERPYISAADPKAADFKKFLLCIKLSLINEVDESRKIHSIMQLNKKII